MTVSWISLIVLWFQVGSPLAGLDEFDLRMLAEEARWRGEWRQCAELYRLASESDSVRAPGNSFEMARCLASASENEGAISALEKAVHGGFRQPAPLEARAEFRKLHAMPRWKQIAERFHANERTYRRKVNLRLYECWLADQAERRGAPGAVDSDARRQRIVSRILASGVQLTSEDYFHAGFIFQHAVTLDGSRRAHALALKAVELDPHNDRARWLVAASKDRELLLQNKPQRYGTHFERHRDGTITLRPVDPTVSDQERKRWNIMPLSRMQLNVARTNRFGRRS